MLKMAHRILSQKIQTIHAVNRTKDSAFVHNLLDVDELKDAVAASEVIIADNVAEYFFEGWDREWTDKDFPYVMPPFPRLFIEYSIPVEHSKWCEAGPVSQVGVMMETREVPGDREAKFNTTVIYFITSNGGVGVMDGRINMAFRKDGSIIGIKDVDGLMSRTLFPALLAISFMHCKNVVHRDVTEFEGPSAKWIRRQKAPVVKYRILDINPMKEVLRTEGGSETNGLKKALHICRGHFATYTADKPLFGNIVGTVWKPAHVRGDIKQGAVVKDYSVSPPVK